GNGAAGGSSGSGDPFGAAASAGMSFTAEGDDTRASAAFCSSARSGLGNCTLAMAVAGSSAARPGLRRRSVPAPHMPHKAPPRFTDVSAGSTLQAGRAVTHAPLDLAAL